MATKAQKEFLLGMIKKLYQSKLMTQSQNHYNLGLETTTGKRPWMFDY